MGAEVVQPRQSIHWPSLLQLAFSGLAALGLWGAAFATGLAAGMGQLDRSLPFNQAVGLWARAGGLALAGLLLIPSAYYALMRILGRPALPGPKLPSSPAFQWFVRLLPLILIGIWVLVLEAVELASQAPSVAGWLLPPLYVLAIGLPVGWYLLIGLRGLRGGSPQRLWGVFAAGLSGNPALIIAVELLLLGLVILAAIVVLLFHPEWTDALTRLAQRLANTPLNTESVIRILRPYLLNPAVIYIGLALISGFVPLIEEALKPLPVWLLAGRRLTPEEGFVAGLLSGAGFALFESMGILSASTGNGWASLAIGRAGTDLLHILNTGLMGWALASAWSERRYLRLGLTYFGAALVHGVWNVLSILMGFVPLLDLQGYPGLKWTQQTPIFQILLGILFAGLLMALLRMNGVLRRVPPAAGDRDSTPVGAESTHAQAPALVESNLEESNLEESSLAESKPGQ